MTNIFEYSVEYSPDPASVTIDVSLSDTSLEATISSVPSFSFHLTPVGNFIQKILSEILTPIATLIANDASDKPKNLLEGQPPISLFTFVSYTVDNIVITPEQLALGSYTVGGDEMLEVTGSLSLAPKLSERSRELDS